MSPIEAMGKAHYERRTGHNTTFNINPRWRDLSARDKQREIDAARAALTALRDNGVTEGMAKAYILMMRRDMPPNPNEVIRAMLDAALEL